MKVSLVPLRAVVGDLEGNCQKILSHVEKESARGAELIVFPELSLLGYPPEDLLLRPNFRKAAAASLDRLELQLRERGLDKVAVLLGSIHEQEQDGVCRLFNGAVFLFEGKREWRYKTLIPAYDVFNESRYFSSGKNAGPILYKGKKIGVLICEDSWDSIQVQQRKQYTQSPTQDLLQAGANLLINLSASPYEKEKIEQRLKVLSQGARTAKLQLLYVNQLGANDQLIFAGETYAFSADGNLSHNQELFTDSALVIDLDAKRTQGLSIQISQSEKMESLRQALVWGIRDYAAKNNFQKAVLGISGGIDSALVAVLAAEALGPQNIIGISMPSKFSSGHSIIDAEVLAKNLGIVYRNFPIKFIQSTLLMALKPYFQSFAEDVTEENLQSRLRGLTVMAFSNKLKAMALATGNKSEFAVGYATLYGDTCGALAPLGDLYKTEVYALAAFINKFQEIIPLNTINKAPSAELRPNQTDQDSLPPYDLLDRILFHLIELEESPLEAVEGIYRDDKRATQSLIEDIVKKIQQSEFKRHQVPPILKTSAKAFGRGRCYPLTGRY
jgi:NAD+ synthase (glutamine-hydrolysing)